MRTHARRAVRATAGIVAVAALAVTAAPTAASPTHSRPSKPPGQSAKHALQQAADALRDSGVPGVLVEVRTPDGAIEVRSGTADTRTGRPIPPDAHFRIGSITKTYVATVVLQLVAEGRLGLDDPVERFLPGLVRGNGHDGRAITVRQLLQHTSGLPEYMRQTWVADDPTVEDYLAHRFDRHRPESLVRLALRMPPTNAPGERAGYSNTNYVLAGMIIEKVTGRPWETEVRERLVRPLRLRSTFVPRHWPLLPSPVLHGYDRRPDGTLVDASVVDPSIAGAAGAMVSSRRDLTIFVRALIGGKLLPPEQQAEMLRTVPLDEQYANGLGVSRQRTRCGDFWTKDGGIFGYTSVFYVAADGRRSVVVTMSQSSFFTSSWDPAPAFEAFARVVDQAQCGRLVG